MRTAEAGISRREGRCVWSACRCEINTMSAWAALGGGIGPRTRRRWPRRAVRTGSNRTVVPSSCQVLVLCPHHVRDAVTARPARPTVRTLLGLVSEPAEQLPLHVRRPIRTVVAERPSGAMGQGQGSLPSVIVDGSRTSQTNYHRSCSRTVVARAPRPHDQIRLWLAR
jgi:hypothetical protein